MKVLFLIAHPDDEAYGPYGTIITLVHQGHDVHVYCMCDGSRPGAEDVASARVDRFKFNCEIAGAEWKIWGNPDLTLEIKETTEFVTKLVADGNFDTVYTHNISDMNRDHRILAEAALVACRPKPSSTVQKLYFFEVPSSTDWTFHKIQPAFEPNEYVEICDNMIALKKGALSAYDTETYEFPDARSVEAMLTLAKYRGYQAGFHHAEAFQLVFSRCRRNQ
jgi:LmbE family N-acetylglucosaminyl deacetylase